MEFRVIIMKELEPKHSAPKMGREKVPNDQGKGETVHGWRLIGIIEMIMVSSSNFMKI